MTDIPNPTIVATTRANSKPIEDYVRRDELTDAELEERLNDECDIAADYIEGILDILGLNGDLELLVSNGHPTVKVVVEESELTPEVEDTFQVLIGKDGDVLNSLQYLTRQAVSKNFGEFSNVIVDVLGYKDKALNILVQKTKDIITKVKESGENEKVTNLNAFERHNIHDLVAQEGLFSKSFGRGRDRYLVISAEEFSDDTNDVNENNDSEENSSEDNN
ncbi:MAG: hypothetical protein LBN03_01065 [Bifidobacteriaceae bacterium]|jgi:spoIIIJ-associated protein|nr:hypothetical protein [Bifidobacteriaceae bacterium]